MRFVWIAHWCGYDPVWRCTFCLDTVAEHTVQSKRYRNEQDAPSISFFLTARSHAGFIYRSRGKHEPRSTVFLLWTDHTRPVCAACTRTRANRYIRCIETHRQTDSLAGSLLQLFVFINTETRNRNIHDRFYIYINWSFMHLLISWRIPAFDVIEWLRRLHGGMEH